MKNRERFSLLAAVLALAMSAGANAAAADRAGEWLLRARGLAVVPDESSTISVIGGKADAENTLVPEVDVTYFATNHIAFELIAAVTKHDMQALGTSLGRVDLGDVWLLPPTLTVQYHFTESDVFTPYVGAGLNYTHFYDADVPGNPVRDIHYRDAFGPALQAGVDI